MGGGRCWCGAEAHGHWRRGTEREVSGSSGHGVESSRSRDAYTRGEVLFEGLTLALAMAAWTSFTECSLPGPRLLRMRECVTS